MMEETSCNTDTCSKNVLSASLLLKKSHMLIVQRLMSFFGLWIFTRQFDRADSTIFGFFLILVCFRYCIINLFFNILTSS